VEINLDDAFAANVSPLGVADFNLDRADAMVFNAPDVDAAETEKDFREDVFVAKQPEPEIPAKKEKRGTLASIAPDAAAKGEMTDQPRAVGIDILNKDNALPPPQAAPFIRKDDEPPHEPVVYPKSVVRMGGKIIGEYYHDGNTVTKDQRHYIYNSRFIAERLAAGLRNVKARFTQEIHAELIKVTEDAASRVRENARFHFEVSTNEILNDKNLKSLSADLRRRSWDDAEKFANKLNAKIETLGHNYEAMLQEQMERCAERD
jgi:hypothetical protein